MIVLTVLLLAAPDVVLAAETVPKPRLRPSPGTEAAAPAAATPLPKPKPARPKIAEPELAAPDAGKAAEPPPGGTPEPAQGWSAAEVADARRVCSKLLAGLDMSYEAVDPIGQSGGCGAPAPVLVSKVAGVTLTPAATLTCDMAASLHGWVSAALKPAARERLKTEVTGIRTATSYACRRRNNSSSGKMSEHSRANALDMSGFVFASKESGVTVSGGNWGDGILATLGLSKSGSFLEQIRIDACSYFTTVLGPGSDPYHGDHFHVDVLRRKGDYRICQ